MSLFNSNLVTPFNVLVFYVVNTVIAAYLNDLKIRFLTSTMLSR